MNKYIPLVVLAFAFLGTSPLASRGQVKRDQDRKDVEAEHGMINMGDNKLVSPKVRQGTDWYPEAKFGLFIHWGVSSVNNLDISWPMIPGRGLVDKDFSAEEIKEIIETRDYNRYTKRPNLTPNTYWAMAKDFKAAHYDPEKWIIAAKKAGFTYVVLTARHHEGFALWPSAYGDFSTKNYMDGKDLIKLFVDACHKHGLKVGLYYSPPDWYFDKEYMNFMYYKAARNPKLPKLDADLNPRTNTISQLDKERHEKTYAEHIRGQLTELLSNYGKIDLLWFDGVPPIPNGKNVMTREEILALQPTIIMNPRMHGTGDFITFERTPPEKNPDGWAEFCNTWTNSWANSTTEPFRPLSFALGQLGLSSGYGINYLLGVGPNAAGEMSPEVYRNFDLVARWMKTHRESIFDTQELASDEKANVPATAKGKSRYLFAVDEFETKNDSVTALPRKDLQLVLETKATVGNVIVMASKKKLSFEQKDGKVTIDFPASMRDGDFDVVKLTLR